MRRLRAPLSMAGAIFALWSGSATAQRNSVPVQECCLPLLFPYGARAVSLGHTLTSRTSTDGLFFNPASLSGNREDQFVIHHADTFEGQTNVFTLLFDAGVAGAFALTYVLVDQGEETAFDEHGTETGTLGLRHQQLIASFATTVRGGLRGGVSYKLYNFGYNCTGFCGGLESSGTTHLLDAGLQYRPGWSKNLEVGASVLHFGFPLQLVNAEQADPTPVRIRFGASYEVGHHFRPDSSIAVWLSADVEDRLREPGSPVGGIGAEVGFDQTIFVRAGYSGSGQGITKGGAGIGIGIHYERFTIGVAKSFTRSELETEGEPFQISFGIVF